MKPNELFLVFVVAVGVGLLAACGSPPPEEEEAEAQPENEEAGVPVRVAQVARGDISTSILSTAVIEAEQTVDIYSRVTGTVTAIVAEEGRQVQAGQLLCSLEDEELRLNEARARAEMEKLERDLERTRTLVDQGILTDTELINAEYTYQQAVIAWQQEQTNLEYAEIRSTINAIVAERSVRLGQRVNSAARLYRLFDPSSLVVNIHIPERDYFRRVDGHTDSIHALIHTDSLPDMEFLGTIKRVAPVVDSTSNTIKITIEYQDPNLILRPGMYVRVQLITDTHHDVVLVPKNAVVYDENRMFVFVVRDDAARRVMLREGGYEDIGFFEAVSGIEEGESVVVVGQDGLRDGTEVQITTAYGAEVEPGAESETAEEAEPDQQPSN